MAFQRTFTGTKWEKETGDCRAVRAGDHIYVTGCASVEQGGGTLAPGDAYGQSAGALNG